MCRWIGSALVHIIVYAGLLSIGHLGTKLREILIKTQTFSFTKMHLKISSVKWPRRDELSSGICTELCTCRAVEIVDVSHSIYYDKHPLGSHCKPFIYLRNIGSNISWSDLPWKWYRKCISEHRIYQIAYLIPRFTCPSTSGDQFIKMGHAH